MLLNLFGGLTSVFNAHQSILALPKNKSSRSKAIKILMIPNFQKFPESIISKWYGSIKRN